MAIAALSPARAAERAQSKRVELTQVQKQLEQTRREIEQYKKLEQSLGGELTNLKSRNEEARRKMQELQRNIRLAEVKKDGLKSRLGALGQASGFWRSELASDMRGFSSALASRSEVYGTRELWAEAFRRAAIMEKANLMAGLQGISRKTQAAAAETGRRAQDLLTRSRKVQAEQQSREEEVRRKQAAMAEAQRKKTEAIARAEELAATAKALTRLLKTLERGSRARTGTAASRLGLAPNSLSWPASGEVVQRFGRERNPELDTWVIHQGLTLQTPADAPVSAVRQGRIIFSGPFRSYGQVIIVDHGDNFFSIYGQLGSALKEKGSEVGGGETIARAGRGDDGNGRVYLELRRGTEALDPLLWLQKK